MSAHPDVAEIAENPPYDTATTSRRIESLSDAEAADEVARLMRTAGHQEEARSTPTACATALRRHVLGISRAWDQRYAPDGIGAGVMIPAECLTMIAAADLLDALERPAPSNGGAVEDMREIIDEIQPGYIWGSEPYNRVAEKLDALRTALAALPVSAALEGEI